MDDIFPTQTDKQAALQAQFETKGKGAADTPRKRGPRRGSKKAHKVSPLGEALVRVGSESVEPDYAKLGRIVRELSDTERAILAQMLS